MITKKPNKSQIQEIRNGILPCVWNFQEKKKKKKVNLVVVLGQSWREGDEQ